MAPASLVAGGSGSFRVRLLGGAPGSASGTVSIVSDDASSPYTFTVVGTVTGPVVSVTGVANGSTYSFGSTPVGVGDWVTFTISSTHASTPITLEPPTLAS